MGLDSVELVIEIEDCFDAPISDQASLAMRTPGDIFDYLVKTRFMAVEEKPLMRCLFHDLRRAVVSEFRVGARNVRPKAPIVEAIPAFRTKARRDKMLERLALPRSPQVLSGMLGLRRDFGTFGDLAKDLLARNYGELSRRLGTWHSREAWNCLRYIISFQMGVKIEKVTRDVRLVNDLGLS
jgi:hypothetical protein